MAYRKTVKGDNNSADEMASHNRIFVDFNGAGVVMLAGFFIACCIACIAWMMVARSGLLEFLIETAFIGVFVGAGAIGALFLMRYYSGTRRQLNGDEAERHWQQNVHYTGEHVLVRDPVKNTYTVHNARMIEEVHHHAAPLQISEVAGYSDEEIMPHLNTRNGA
jgi:hypothetical protein